MNIHEISNAVIIDYLDTIIHQESQKLKKDKSTGLLAKSIESSQIHHLPSGNQSKCLNSLKLSVSKNDQSYSPKQRHLYERDNEIERLANIFTQSPGFFTSNNNNNYNIDSKHNQALLKRRVNTQTYNEGNNRSEKMEIFNKTSDDLKDSTKYAPFIDGSKSCTIDDDQFNEHNKMKQEIYRHELIKQIEEKKLLDEERKRKEQIEDEAIEKAAKERDEKLRKEYEREIEERALLQLQKRLMQEKLKDELLEKQKAIETKSRAIPITTFSKPEIKQVQTHCEFPTNYKFEQLECPPQNAFDDIPLPTTIVRAPRKIMYNDTDEELQEWNINKPDYFSTNINDTFKNPCMNHHTSPVVRPKIRVGKNAIRQPKEPPTHVTFATDPPFKRNLYNPDTKSVIVDSPLTLALASINIDEDTTSKSINKPIKTSYKHSVPERTVTLSDFEFSDKDLLSNLGNIRKQLDIDHQHLKQKLKNF